MDRLRTESLLLDPLAREDFSWLFALYADAEVMRYIGRGVRTEEESRRNLDWLVAHGERLPFGYWVLRERATGARLGGAVLMIRREGAPAELGFMLARPAWGRGLATQVARALVAHAFADLTLPELQAFTDVGNGASAKQVASETDLIGGPNAYGKSGDYLLQNANARFIAAQMSL